MALTGSLRVGFLLPSLLAGIGTVLLVYDLLRRVHGREAALAGALVLLFTCQFVWQARQAQIDATLCFLTTASLYGLLRHLLVAPAPGWFLAGWAAAGLGVITKGVGFLPLLVLIPIGVLAARGWPVAARSCARAVDRRPARSAGRHGRVVRCRCGSRLRRAANCQDYRNEILLHQTRHALWRGLAPPRARLVLPDERDPLLWLPLIALVPWLWPRWRRSLARRDTLTAALLAWVLIVIAFFSASTGKRGVYVLPALPALAMAAAPWLPELLRARGPRRLHSGARWRCVTLLSGALAAYLALAGTRGTARCRAGRRRTRRPARRRRPGGAAQCSRPSGCATPGSAWTGTLAAVLLVTGFMIYPRIDATRSGRAFMQIVARCRALTSRSSASSIPASNSCCSLRGRSCTSGATRWREPEREAADAARWLDEDPRRALVVDALGARCVLRAGARRAARTLASSRLVSGARTGEPRLCGARRRQRGAITTCRRRVL